MHLVFLNQYYPPDAAPTGVMLQAVAEECARQGHQVTVICAAGVYAGGRRVVSGPLSVVSEDGGEEELSVVGCPLSERKLASALAQPTTDSSSTLPNQKSEIHNHQSSISHSSPIQHSLPTILRLPATRFGRGTFVGKLLDYASYYVGVAWRLGTMNPPPDRIVALTTPPYLSVLARAVSKLRGADHAHWVMDLYPDVMVAHGMLAEGGWKHRLLAGLARWGFGGRRCAAVLTLGPDMAERVRRHWEESTAKAQRSQRDAEENESVVGGPLSEKILPGPRVSSPAEPMDGESPARQEPLAASPDTSFPPHRPSESGDSRSGAAAQPTTVTWVPLWGAEGKDEELSVVRGQWSETILPGPRVSSPAEPMVGESPVRQVPLAASPDTSFPPHRPCESGDSRSGAEAQQTTDNRQPTTASLRAKRGWADDELVVMYSGNMGLGHRFGEVLEVARRGEDEELSVVRCQWSETILPGPRVSSPAESMDGESPARQEPIAASPDTSFPAQRRCESGDSRSGTAAPQTTDNRPPTTLQKHRFVFYGGGKRRGEIEAFMAAHPEAPVELHDYAPAEELTAHLMTADVHLVSLEPAWSGTMVPSKLQGIFAVGRPVVFVGSRESSIGRWVEESGGGWVVAAGDVDGLRSALEEARDPNVRQARGEAAGRFASECFDRETNVRRVVEALVGDSRSAIQSLR